MNLTREKIFEIVNWETVRYGRDTCFKMDDLIFPFGFKRLDGIEITLRQLITPSKTEKELSTAPKYEVHQNIENWCRENHIIFYYDMEKDSYFFRFKITKQ